MNKRAPMFEEDGVTFTKEYLERINSVKSLIPESLMKDFEQKKKEGKIKNFDDDMFI